MKKVLTITLALLLAACGTAQPAVQQEPPTAVVQTVVVIATTEVPPPTAIPTQAPPTLAPTNTLAPADTPTAAPTETLVPTSAPAATEVLPPVAATSDLTPVGVPNDLGKGVFKDISLSSNLLTLRCYPREININITANLPEIVSAIMYYRMVDNPGALYPSEWINLGEMQSDKQGHFSLVLEGLDLSPNLRVLEKAWIDFQFIGINKGGGVVDRTQKIERLVTYLKECP